MRTTLELPDPVVARARNLSGIVRISDLVREGLQALIEREARRRLIAFGGADPDAAAGPRGRYSESVAEPDGSR